jgi:hypothetical protein
MQKISCKPINGTKENLIPSLTHVDIQQQNKDWDSATYIEIEGKPINLTCHFAQVTDEQAMQDAEKHWKSPNISSKKHKVGHQTYNPCLLAIVLMNSISDTLTNIIINCVYARKLLQQH